MFPTIALFGLCSTVVTVLQVAASPPRPVSVDVASIGRIDGLQYALDDGTLVDAFTGIPYAKPPLGALRFRPPVAPDPPATVNGTAVIDATRLPATCFQVVDTEFESKFVDMWNPNTNLSEDCLYLNVWKPAATKSGSGRAVMVWIYGGGFTSGTSTLPLYDGKFMASRGDVVVVSMQYRLGPLGFLALGGSEADWPAPGNVGLLDQQFALAWVAAHIGAFGGDPARVTLFGESAGSASVSYHLLSPGSANLFRSAILESAAVQVDWNYDEPKHAMKSARSLAKRVGCDRSSDKETMDCMRLADAGLLTAEQWNVAGIGPELTSAFRPTVDGQFIRRAPANLLAAGEFQKKSIIAGANRNEGIYFLIYLFKALFDPHKSTPPAGITADTYRSLVRNLSVLDTSTDFVVDAVGFEYSTPCDSGWNAQPDYPTALDQLLGDAIFVCPLVNFARTFARQADGNHSVYVYQFNHRTSGNPWPVWTGVAHGYEIDHVFGVPSQAATKSLYTDDERTLSSRIVAYWTNFAKTGDPNKGEGSQSSNAPNWPKYAIDNRTVLVLDTGNKMVTQTGLHERQCDFWINVVPQLEAAAAAAGDLRAVGLMWTILACLMARFFCCS